MLGHRDLPEFVGDIQTQAPYRLNNQEEYLMPVLNQIAYFQNRRDEVPNQELARELAERKIGRDSRNCPNLWHENQMCRVTV